MRSAETSTHLVRALFALVVIVALGLLVVLRGRREHPDASAAPPPAPAPLEPAGPTATVATPRPTPENEPQQRDGEPPAPKAPESQQPRDDKLEQTDARLEEMQARAARLKHEIRALDGAGNKAGAAQRKVMLKRLEAEMQRVRAARP